MEEKEIEQILKQVQAFDPVGIAARDLKECLLIQLRRKGEGESAHLSDSRGKLYSDDEARKIAILILEKYFEEFTRKHYDKIQKSLHLDESRDEGSIASDSYTESKARRGDKLYQ